MARIIFYLFMLTLPVKYEKYEILDVVDGDSIVVNYNPYTEIRLLEVDCPELEETWWSARSAKNYVLKFKNRSIYAVKDISESDEGGRLLRHVYITQGKEVIWLNKDLIERGYATPLHVFPDLKYKDYFDHIYNRVTINRRTQ